MRGRACERVRPDWADPAHCRGNQARTYHAQQGGVSPAAFWDPSTKNVRTTGSSPDKEDNEEQTTTSFRRGILREIDASKTKDFEGFFGWSQPDVRIESPFRRSDTSLPVGWHLPPLTVWIVFKVVQFRRLEKADSPPVGIKNT